MSDIELRIKVAELCGWKQPDKLRWPNLPSRWFWIVPDATDFEFDEVPDYCNDLNAMHEAEKMLTDDDWEVYINSLIFLDVQIPIHATARQRAEAFVKTMQGIKG